MVVAGLAAELHGVVLEGPQFVVAGCPDDLGEALAEQGERQAMSAYVSPTSPATMSRSSSDPGRMRSTIARFSA
jgi:hypothetical protein